MRELRKESGDDVRTMVVFPGQGAQKQGMCKTLIGSNGAQKIFARASRILGYELSIENTANDQSALLLSSTEHVQILLFVSTLAKLEQLKETEPELMQRVTCTAGLSVGEIAALVFAGAIDFEDGLKYVQIRGKTMEEEVRQHPSGMVSVFGPVRDGLEQFLEEHFPTAEISTYLADNQHCIAGCQSICEAILDQLTGAFKDALGVIDARILRVAGAFHSSYMKGAAAQLAPALEALQIRTPVIPVAMNYSGTFTTDPKRIKEELGKQIYSPVMWKSCMVEAVNAGVRHFVELSPSRVLSSIVQNRIEICKNHACSQRWVPV